MASKNIDQLAAASTLSDTDKLVVAQGDAVLKRGTLAQVRTLLAPPMPEATIKGRAAGTGTGTPVDLTPEQARVAIGVDVVLRSANLRNVKAFGATGAGDLALDNAAFTAALATTGPVLVPAGIYLLTTLSIANRLRLYGEGEVFVAGVRTQISSAPITNDVAAFRAFSDDWRPSKWPTVDGSLYNGAGAVDLLRTGGFGTYGASLINLTVSAAVPSPQFDVVSAGWLTTQNLTGGQAFGSWFGANSPSSALGQTFTGGGVIGAELNAGNRWGDPGLSLDYSTRFYVGLQLVPDVLPAKDGATASVFPGSFAYTISQSIHGHKWWVGGLIRPDTIMPGGWSNVFHGGTTALLAPLGAVNIRGFYNRGLDLAAATFVNDTAINLGSGHFIRFGGGAIVGTATAIALNLPAGAGNLGHLYVNNFGSFSARWGWNGTNPTIGFLGAIDVARQTVSGSRGGNAALQSLLTALVNFGLITDTTT